MRWNSNRSFLKSETGNVPSEFFKENALTIIVQTQARNVERRAALRDAHEQGAQVSPLITVSCCQSWGETTADFFIFFLLELREVWFFEKDTYRSLQRSDANRRGQLRQYDRKSGQLVRGGRSAAAAMGEDEDSETRRTDDASVLSNVQQERLRILRLVL